MILAVFSEDLPPPNAVSSILLNMHFLFLILTYSSSSSLICSALVSIGLFSIFGSIESFLCPMFSYDLSFCVSIASGPAFLKSFTHLANNAGVKIPCERANS